MTRERSASAGSPLGLADPTLDVPEPGNAGRYLLPGPRGLGPLAEGGVRVAEVVEDVRISGVGPKAVLEHADRLLGPAELVVLQRPSDAAWLVVMLWIGRRLEPTRLAGLRRAYGEFKTAWERDHG